MFRTNLPRAVRELRRRRRWRQVDLATLSGVSRQVISRVERGQLNSVPLRTLVRVAAALDASIDLTVRWRGEALDRLVDAAHAGVVQTSIQLLASTGWRTRVEVTFNHYGDRGSIDVLAMHPGSRTVVVIEAKSAIGKADETLSRLDVKARLGSMVAESIGWERPLRVIPALVIADTRPNRRTIADHDPLFGRFDTRGRQAWAWLRQPAGTSPSGLLWFAKLPDSRPGSVTRSARVRTRRDAG